MYRSRLQYRYNRQSQKKIVLMLCGSVIVLVLIILYGFPLVLNFSGTISGLARKPSAVAEKELPPNTPRISEDLEATSSALAIIKGVADSKVTVEIFQNSRSLGTVISSDDGSFNQEADLEKGSNVFTAQAISESGLKSSLSSGYTLLYLSGKPKLEIDSLKDGDTINSSPLTISGTTDPNDSISINDRLAIVSRDGKFSYTLNLNSGDNKLRIVASDLAGNETVKELTIKYQQ